MRFCAIKFITVFVLVLNSALSSSNQSRSNNSEVCEPKESNSKRIVNKIEFLNKNKNLQSSSRVHETFIFKTIVYKKLLKLKILWFKHACIWRISRLFLGELCVEGYTTADSTPSSPAERFRPIYTFFSQKLTWMEAHLFCKEQGGELTTVVDMKEFDLLIKLINDQGLVIPNQPLIFWTSGNDVDREGMFTWFSTGQPIVPVPFLPAGNREPSGGPNENCVYFANIPTSIGGSGQYFLNDQICNTKNSFICKRLERIMNK